MRTYNYQTKREALNAAMVHLMGGDGYISEKPGALHVFTEDGEPVAVYNYTREG